jgi:hypothetical protein
MGREGLACRSQHHAHSGAHKKLLRSAASMETESSVTDNPQEETTTDKTGRPPPIVITAAPNRLQLQRFIMRVVKETFELKYQEWNKVPHKVLGGFRRCKIIPRNPQSPLFYLLHQIPKTHQDRNTPSPYEHPSTRYIWRTDGSRFWHYQCQTNDNHPSVNVWESPHHKPPLVPRYVVRVETYRAQNGLT